MSELEEKLGAVLQNPQLMQQILGMAKQLSAQESPPPEAHTPQPKPSEKKPPEKKPPEQACQDSPSFPQPDPRAMQMLLQLAGNGAMDQNQQGLLQALQPYLSRSRITRLERAMGAARMARSASAFLNTGGLQALLGRDHHV